MSITAPIYMSIARLPRHLLEAVFLKNVNTDRTLAKEHHKNNIKKQMNMASSSVSTRDSLSSDSSITSSNDSHAINNDEIIALFGIHGATGSQFVKLALDAGYIVQALVPTKSVVSLQHSSLTLVEGTLDDGEKLAQVVHGATFVVSMLGSDTLPSKKEYPAGHLLDFCKALYPIMKESPTKLFLYQVSIILCMIDDAFLY